MFFKSMCRECDTKMVRVRSCDKERKNKKDNSGTFNCSPNYTRSSHRKLRTAYTCHSAAAVMRHRKSTWTAPAGGLLFLLGAGHCSQKFLRGPPCKRLPSGISSFAAC